MSMKSCCPYLPCQSVEECKEVNKELKTCSGCGTCVPDSSVPRGTYCKRLKAKNTEVRDRLKTGM